MPDHAALALRPLRPLPRVVRALARAALGRPGLALDDGDLRRALAGRHLGSAADQAYAEAEFSDHEPLPHVLRILPADDAPVRGRVRHGGSAVLACAAFDRLSACEERRGQAPV